MFLTSHIIKLIGELPFQYKTSNRFGCNVYMLSFKERNLLVLMHDKQNTLR